MDPYDSDSTPYFGSIVGRVANRIAKGAFSLEGKDYSLAINNAPNTLHGGPKGCAKRLWRAVAVDVPGLPPSLKLTLDDPDGHEGYPGDLVLGVTYTLLDSNELTIDMQVPPPPSLPPPPPPPRAAAERALVRDTQREREREREGAGAGGRKRERWREREREREAERP
eukprot:SAG11_NODE_1380_length_5081_cov_6.100963_5_plen_168_part_00